MDQKIDQNIGRKIRHYEVLKTIGAGGFGIVYLCEDKNIKEKFAIKEIKEKNKSKIDPKMEIEIHKRLASKKGNRVVKIIEDFVENGYVYLVMAYCKEGSLRDFVKKNGPMEVLLATDVLAQLCEVLRVMHEMNIAHRDLTPGNVLIREIKRGRNDEVKRLIVKVTDFGLSKETSKNGKGLKTILGTPHFMAPEVKEGKFYTMAADIFSLGSVFYYMLTAKYLLDKNSRSRFDLSFTLSNVMAMRSVRKLDEEVQGDLRRFIRAMLCSEEDRIKLEEINSDNEQFMLWFYTERYVIDPELRDLRSHSQSGPLGRRRNSRDKSQEPVARPKRPNKDSALGSDQQIQSSSSRCRHEQIDVSGRCRNCLYRTSSFTTNRENTGFEKLHHASAPVAKNNQMKFSDSTNKPNQRIRSQPTIAAKSAPMALELPTDDRNLIYNSKQPPWPMPKITKDYVAVNEYGRCILKDEYDCDKVGQLQLFAILEKTASKEDQTIKRIFELWQSETKQELRMLEPENPSEQIPEKNAPRIRIKRSNKNKIIKNYNELCDCKAAKDGYEKLWGFVKLVASKVWIANCEEIRGGRKYRLELYMNNYLNLYVGPKEVKDPSNLTLTARQKTEDGPLVEQPKCNIILSTYEKELVRELAAALRHDYKQSIWASERYTNRNIRCTIYTRGYK